MTSFHFSIDPRSRKAGRFIRKVRSEIQKALLAEKRKRKLTQAAIAEKLGVNRSVINRQLTGDGELTLRAIADFAWVLGRDIDFRLVEPNTSESNFGIFCPAAPPQQSIESSPEKNIWKPFAEERAIAL